MCLFWYIPWNENAISLLNGRQIDNDWKLIPYATWVILRAYSFWPTHLNINNAYSVHLRGNGGKQIIFTVLNGATSWLVAQKNERNQNSLASDSEKISKSTSCIAKTQYEGLCMLSRELNFLRLRRSASRFVHPSIRMFARHVELSASERQKLK